MIEIFDRNQCFCGNSYGRFGPKSEETKCNIPCAGEITKICGAAWFNSVYKV